MNIIMMTFSSYSITVIVTAKNNSLTGIQKDDN